MTFNNVNEKNMFPNQPVKNGKPFVIDIESFPVVGSQKIGFQKIVEDKEEDFEEKNVINYRTKPCRNVTNNKNGVGPGICYRKKCTFAHSIEEWRISVCRYDYNCRYFYGKYNSLGYIIKGSVCRFKHTCETVDEWLKRTNQQKPNLPLHKVTTTAVEHNYEKFVITCEDEEDVEEDVEEGVEEEEKKKIEDDEEAKAIERVNKEAMKI